MKNTKIKTYSVGFAAILVLLFASKGFAAEETTDYRSKMTNLMKQQLSLTDEQAAQIKAITEKYQSANDNSEAASSDTRQENRKELFQQKKEQREKMQNEINSVLTEDQQKQFEQIRQNKKMDHRQNGPKTKEWKEGLQGREKGKHWQEGPGNDHGRKHHHKKIERIETH